MTIRIELDSVRKYRSKTEYRTVNRASCGGVTVTSDGDNIQKLCAILIENNHQNTVVEVYRAGTLCFLPETLGKWASGKFVMGEQPEHLKRAK